MLPEYLSAHVKHFYGDIHLRTRKVMSDDEGGLRSGRILGATQTGDVGGKVFHHVELQFRGAGVAHHIPCSELQ